MTRITRQSWVDTLRNNQLLIRGFILPDKPLLTDLVVYCRCTNGQGVDYLAEAHYRRGALDGYGFNMNLYGWSTTLEEGASEAVQRRHLENRPKAWLGPIQTLVYLCDPVQKRPSQRVMQADPRLLFHLGGILAGVSELSESGTGTHGAIRAAESMDPKLRGFIADQLRVYGRIMPLGV